MRGGDSSIFTTRANMGGSFAWGRFFHFHHQGRRGRLICAGEILPFSQPGPTWEAHLRGGDSSIFTTRANMGGSFARGRFFHFHHQGQHGRLICAGEILPFSPPGLTWEAYLRGGDSFIFTTRANMGGSFARGRFFHFHHQGQHGRLVGAGEILVFSQGQHERLICAGGILSFSPPGPTWEAHLRGGDSTIFTIRANVGGSFARGRFFHFHHQGQHGRLICAGEILQFSPPGLTWEAHLHGGDSSIFTTRADVGG